MSSRKVIIKKSGDTFRVVKVTGPKAVDVDLIGTNMTSVELKKFISNAGVQTVIEIVE